MSSSDEDYSQSQDESHAQQRQRSTGNSKKARVPSYSESSQEDAPQESQSSLNEEKSRKAKHSQTGNGDEGEDPDDQEQHDDQEGYPDGGVFFPDIEYILWKRKKQSEEEYEYLVKYKEYSYLQCEWIDEKEVIAGEKNGKQKLNRFNKNFEKRLRDLEVEADDLTASQHYFDQSFVEVDRILQSVEMFPVIHPKKANELKEKWTELMTVVVAKLLSYSKDKVKYGIYFMEPVNPETDGCPDYRKKVTQPMDLGTVLNRLYLDYYVQPKNFWYELGLVFKNCRLYNRDEESEIRTLCDTLREAAIVLYQQWHMHQGKRFHYLTQLAEHLQEGHPQFVESLTQENKLALVKIQGEQHLNETASRLITLLGEKVESNPLEQEIMVDRRKIADLLKHFSIEDEHQLFQEHSQVKCSELIASLKTHFGQRALPQVEVEHSEDALLRQALEMTKEQIKTDTERYLPVLGNAAELELRNPGAYTLEWLQDEDEDLSKYEFMFVQPDDAQLDITVTPDTLYLIKWKNLSYKQATWEHLSNINMPLSKLNEFRQFNRALDRDTRQLMIRDCQHHKALLDYESKKRSRYSASQLSEIKNSLYQLNVSATKQPLRYTARTQPIFKDRRLLRDYQLESLNWMIEAFYSNRNVLLADEMGLGKTIQSIAFLNYLYQLEACRGPFLVVAPLSTLAHWKRTVEEWTTLNVVLYYDQAGIEGRQACFLHEQFYIDISTRGTVLPNRELYKFQILITSYEVFNQDIQLLLAIPFRFVIVDEAHRLKNQQAKILATLRRLPCKRVTLLTGTPVQNNTDELWSLLNFIEPAKFRSLNDFKADFGELTSAEQIERLGTVLKPYILRRQKEDVESSIPPLQENIIDIEMTTLQKTIYRALYERNKGSLLKGFSQYTAQTASLNNLEMQLRKCCNHPMLIKELFNEMVGKCGTDQEYMKTLIEASGKMILLDKMINKFVGEKKKILIFSQFTQMLALLEDYLSAKALKYEKITGDIKSTERQNSIDRFNDPVRGRSVFLLSTKAGGQGINLTAAEVVIIYDSDWNPQNDVQATARAHRIGQDKEVAVYRLITKNTYESEMFERATKKLGLDQAIFMSGEFKQAQLGEIDDQRFQGNKKLSKAEMELLLKRGSLGLLEQQMQEENNILDQDIDDVLNNTRIARYSLIQGSYTISKQSYVSEKEAQGLDVNDPDFWQKVLKNQETKSMKLLRRFETEYKAIIANLRSQKEFLLELAECINALVEAKVSQQGFSTDDENNITDILNRVAFKEGFNPHFQGIATNWICEVNKSSRRFKPITEQDLEGPTKIQEEEVKPPIKLPQTDFKWQEGEEAKKLQSKSKQDLLSRLCAVCDRPKCTFFCIGFCRQSFHDQCRVANKAPRGQKPKEFDWEPEQLQAAIDITYLCPGCSRLEGECFICKKTASFNPQTLVKPPQKAEEEESTKASDQVKNDQVVVDSKGSRRTRAVSRKEIEAVNVFVQGVNADLVKCSMFNCSKLYHYACVQTNRDFKILDGQTQRFKCALHFCCRCKQKSDEHSGVLQCLRCPRAFHQKCLTKDIHKFNKKYILCNNHKVIKTEAKTNTNGDGPKQERSDSPQQPEIKKKAKPEANKERDERNHKSRKEDKRSQKHKEKVQKAQRDTQDQVKHK